MRRTSSTRSRCGRCGGGGTPLAHAGLQPDALAPQELADDDAVPEGENIEIRTGEAEQPNKERVTTRYMTKYEKARILGTRALQIRCAGRKRGARHHTCPADSGCRAA